MKQTIAVFWVSAFITVSAAAGPSKSRPNLITVPASGASAVTRTVLMRDEDVVTIQCRPRHNTMLSFQDGGEVSVASGGDVDKNRWVIDSPSTTRRMSVLNVKPARFGPEAQTDLNVVTTTGHSYTFLLESCEKCTPDVKVFVRQKVDEPAAAVVDPHISEIERLSVSLDSAQAGEKKAVADAEQAKRDAAAKIDRDITEFRRDYPLSMFTDYSYKRRNTQPFRVLGIWCDDKRTYIQLAGELSSIYTWIDEKPALTQFTYNRAPSGVGGTYVVEGVLGSGYLQLGKKTKLRFDRISK